MQIEPQVMKRIVSSWAGLMSLGAAFATGVGLTVVLAGWLSLPQAVAANTQATAENRLRIEAQAARSDSTDQRIARLERKIDFQICTTSRPNAYILFLLNVDCAILRM